MKAKKLYVISAFFIIFFTSIEATRIPSSFTLIDKTVQEKADALFGQPEISKAFINRDISKLTNVGFILYPTWKSGRSIIAEHPKLEGWIIKGDKRSIYGGRNLARLDYAECLRELIAKYNLDRVHVVEEYLYHLPGKKHTIKENNYLILSKKISDGGDMPLSLKNKVVQQLKFLIRKAGYWDVRKDNIFFVNNNGVPHAIFIDTEPFPSYKTWIWGMVRSLIGNIGAHSFKKMIRKNNESLCT